MCLMLCEDYTRRRFYGGLLFIVAILAVHVILGFIAVFSNGYFIFGATAIERFIIHFLSGDETHITISGYQGEFANDFCFSDCIGCPFDCYPTSSLTLYCSESCGLYTRKGVRIVSERQYFKYLLKNVLLIEDTKFMCYNRTIGDCGFAIKLDENTSLSYDIPNAMKAHSPAP